MEKSEHLSHSSGKFRQCIAAIIVNLSTMAYGISVGWTSPIIPQLRSTNSPVGHAKLTEEQISWITGLLPMGALLVAPFSGSLTEKLGRKGFAYLAGIPHIISWLLITFGTSHVRFLYAARLAGGIGAAMSMFVVPLYVGEIADESIRGALGSVLLFSIKIGILFGYVAGAYLSYRTFAAVSAVFPIVFLVAFFFMPESPVFLVRRNRMIQAEKSLMFFKSNNRDLVTQELALLKSQLNIPNRSTKKISFTRLFRDRATRRGLIISMGLIAGQQFSGIFAMISYAETIFNRAGSSLSSVTSSIIIAAIQVISSYLSILLMERAGRRALSLYSCVGMTLCHIVIGCFFVLHEHKYNVSSYSWLPLIALSSYMITYCLGVGPVTFVVIAEIFHNDVASFAVTVCYIFFWAMASVVMKMFGTAMSLLGGGCFFLLAGSCVGCFVFCYFMVPETKGRKREDIVDELAGIFKGDGIGREAGEKDEGQELVTKPRMKPV